MIDLLSSALKSLTGLRALPFSLAAASALLLASSSCANRGGAGRSVIAESPPPAAAPQSQDELVPGTSGDVHHAVVSDDSANGGVIQPLAYYQDSGSDVPAPSPPVESLEEPYTFVPPPMVAEDLAIRHDPQTRVALLQPAAIAPPFYLPNTPSEEPPYPEEVVCDGGDEGHPFHYEGTERAGLEPEDTVAEYRDHTGEEHIRISSKACVYAPRFSAVRSISLPVTGYVIEGAAGAHDHNRATGLADGVALDLQQQTDQPSGLDIRSRASGLDNDVADNAMHQNILAERHDKLVNIFEDRGSVSNEQFGQTDQAYLSYILQTAGEQVLDEGLVVIAKDLQGQFVQAREQAEEYSVAEDRRPPGELRVVKIANRMSVQPGDTITYTIRVYNDGARELLSVRILDHISPRLEYVAGSVVSDLDGKLTLQDADDGSQVLMFELAKPLDAASMGEIEFDVRVK